MKIKLKNNFFSFTMWNYKIIKNKKERFKSIKTFKLFSLGQRLRLRYIYFFFLSVRCRWWWTLLVTRLKQNRFQHLENVLETRERFASSTLSSHKVQLFRSRTGGMGGRRWNVFTTKNGRKMINQKTTTGKREGIKYQH